MNDRIMTLTVTNPDVGTRHRLVELTRELQDHGFDVTLTMKEQALPPDPGEGPMTVQVRGPT